MSTLQSNRAEQLQFLRFCAFFFIFSLHSSGWSGEWMPIAALPNMGAASVSFFFLLSGLVTGWSFSHKEVDFSLKGWKEYIVKKIKRFYPLYFVVLLIPFMYSGIVGAYSAMDIPLIKSYLWMFTKFALLIQSWFPTHYFDLNPVVWFMSTLLFLYVITLPIISVLSKVNKAKNRNLVFSLICVLSVCLTVIYCFVMRDKDLEFWEFVFPPCRIGEYVAGICLGYILSQSVDKVIDNQRNLVVFTGLEIVSLVFWWYCTFKMEGSLWTFRIVRWLLPNISLLIVFSIGRGYLSKIFRCSFLKHLGDISFELYLVHILVIQLFVVFNGVTPNPQSKLISFLFCMFLSWVFAEFAYKTTKNSKN